METKIKKEFDAVEFMRERRKLLSKKLANMTKHEIIAYFKSRRLEKGIKPSA